MHDIDRTLNIDNLEYDEDNEFDFEDSWHSENDFEFDFELDEELDEESDEELAAELMTVESDHELDEFIGKLVSKAWRRGKQALNSSKGKFLRRHLAGIVRAGAKGGGAKIGEYVGDKAGDWLAKKIEPEMELEVAKKLVRFTKEAAERTQNTKSPQHIKQVVRATAKKHLAPMLSQNGASKKTGRWVRQGKKIIVMT